MNTQQLLEDAMQECLKQSDKWPAEMGVVFEDGFLFAVKWMQEYFSNQSPNNLNMTSTNGPSRPADLDIPQKERELTYGEKAVGIGFNPGKNPEVENIKKKCAAVIDEIYDNHVAPGPDLRNGEVVAMAKIAIRAIQDGQMWAVKAATWQY